jgi:hypothetical protein
MTHFVRELRDILAGPPRISQSDLAAKSRMLKSKVSRIVNGQTPCDKDTLDAILRAVPEREQRTRLVVAFIRDWVSPSALEYVRTGGGTQLAGLNCPGLSRKGAKALEFLLRHDAVERLLITLAETMRQEPNSDGLAAD